MADLRGQQIKDRYETLLTTSVTTANPTTGIVQNGNGNAFTTLTVAGVPLGAGGLDSYETGTWTPGISFSDSGSATVSIFYGKFTKIGNVVTVLARFFVATVSSPVGDLTVTGLPFVIGAGASQAGSLGLMRNWLTNFPRVGLLGNGGSATVSFAANAPNAGATFIGASDVQVNSEVSFTFTYLTT